MKFIERYSKRALPRLLGAPPVLVAESAYALQLMPDVIRAVGMPQRQGRWLLRMPMRTSAARSGTVGSEPLPVMIGRSR